MSKVRTGKTENDVSLYINNSIKRIAKDKATYSNSLDEHQLNLYYAIEYMYTDQKLIPPGKGKLKPISDKPNRGRVYEVYTKYKNKFTPPLTIKEQFRIYNSLKKAKGENISQLKQGDSELTQLKAVFNTSTAQLVPLSELKNFMKDTLKALTEGKTDREKIEKLLSTYTTIGMEEGSKRVLNDALDYVQENFLDKLSGNENLTNIEIVV
jgi:deoxyribodipyrimidine photolyase